MSPRHRSRRAAVFTTGAVRAGRVRLLVRADRVRTGGPTPGRAVARVHQPADVPGRRGVGGRNAVRHRPPPGDGQHARVPVRAGDGAPVHGQPRAGQLPGVARRGVVRGVRGPSAARQAAGAARGAVRPAGPRAAVGGVRGRRVVRPVPGRRRHVRHAALRRTGQGRGHRHGGEHPQRDVRHAAQLRYARTPPKPRCVCRTRVALRPAVSRCDISRGGGGRRIPFSLLFLHVSRGETLRKFIFQSNFYVLAKKLLCHSQRIRSRPFHKVYSFENIGISTFYIHSLNDFS